VEHGLATANSLLARRFRNFLRADGFGLSVKAEKLIRFVSGNSRGNSISLTRPTLVRRITKRKQKHEIGERKENESQQIVQYQDYASKHGNPNVRANP
jgi:hypothetical protein